MHSTTLLFSAAAFAARVYAGTPPAAPAGMHLLWSDEFNGSGNIDLSKWQYYTGGQVNGELEHYSGDHCTLSGSGSLLITPLNVDGQWESCRIETKDAWAPPTGGKLQVQSHFKLGKAGATLQGIWPAFWSLGESMRQGTSWPACGEIDTFENINGQAQGFGTLHCGTTCHGGEGLSLAAPFDYGTPHTWSHIIDITNGDWTQQSITFSLDGNPYHIIHGSDLNNQADWTAVAQKAMYITLNVAVGGTFPGAPAANTASGSDAGMEIDYVAVYST